MLLGSRLSVGAFSALLLVGCPKNRDSTSDRSKTHVGEKVGSERVIRLATVNTPEYGGLLGAILPEFEKESGYSVQIYSGSDVYARARAGEADIVISHFGKHELERFVLDGFGFWPEVVFANQAVIIGPKSDPANIRDVNDASVAKQNCEERDNVLGKPNSRGRLSDRYSLGPCGKAR